MKITVKVGIKYAVYAPYLRTYINEWRFRLFILKAIMLLLCPLPVLIRLNRIKIPHFIDFTFLPCALTSCYSSSCCL
jgi:hypothetical protein